MIYRTRQIRLFFSEHIKNNFLIYFCLLILIFFRKLAIASLFIMLDYLYVYLRKKYRIDLGTNYLLIGIVIFSYSISYKIGLLLVPFFVFNRLLQGSCNLNLVLSIISLSVIAYAAGFLSFAPIYYAAILLYLFKYIIDTLFEILFEGGIKFQRIPYRIFHIVVAYVFIISLGNLFVGLVR